MNEQTPHPQETRHAQSDRAIKSCKRAAHVPADVLTAVFQADSNTGYHLALIELADLIRRTPKLRDLRRDFTVFAQMVALIARRPGTRSNVTIEVSALRRKNRPATALVVIQWDHWATDLEDWMSLAETETDCSIVSNTVPLELSIPPKLTRELWAQFALELNYACFSEDDELLIRIPLQEEGDGLCA